MARGIIEDMYIYADECERDARHAHGQHRAWLMEQAREERRKATHLSLKAGCRAHVLLAHREKYAHRLPLGIRPRRHT